MAFIQPPAWLENSIDHNAQDYRALLASLVDASGVAHTDALRVTEKAGTTDLSVDVAAGGAFIKSTRSDAQGVYHVYNDATVNVALAAADATNPRIDLIVVQIRDEAQDAALTENDVRPLVVQGTPAASPTAPTITIEDYMLLAQVEVAALAESITDADITDLREVASTVSAPVRTVEILAGAGTIPTTETTRATGTLSIPPHWRTWDLKVLGTVDTKGFGGSGSETLTFRPKIDGVTLTTARLFRAINSAVQPMPVPLIGRSLGRTDTGDLTVTVTVQMSAQSNLAAYDSIGCLFEAVRRS